MVPVGINLRAGSGPNKGRIFLILNEVFTQVQMRFLHVDVGAWHMYWSFLAFPFFLVFEEGL